MPMNANTVAMMAAAMQNNDSPASVHDMISNLPDLDPRTKSMLELFSTSVETTEVASIDHQRFKSLMKKSRQTISELRERLDMAIDVIDRLADACGACPDCFGENNSCHSCSGIGRPGWRSPDPTLYKHIIKPAVERASTDSALIESKTYPTLPGDHDATGRL